MKFFFALIALALACGPAAAANANGFVDQIINSIKANPKMDPFMIPDQSIKIDRKHHDQNGHNHGGLHLIGDLHLKNMKIEGLSHVHREGDADLTNENGSFSAHIHLGDENIKVFGDLTVDIIKFLHPHLKFEADIGAIAVKIGVAMVDGKPKLEEFDIDEFKHVKFHVHGLALLDPIIDVAADAFVAIFNTQARHLLTVELRTVIEQQLQHFTPGGSF